MVFRMDTPCEEWPGYRNKDGYGITGAGRVAHRALWEKTNGPVPKGLELDHLCRVRACVRLDHLEPVTHTENMRRGSRANVTSCPAGHPYSLENTYISPKNQRICKSCRRDRDRLRFSKGVRGPYKTRMAPAE